MESAASVLQPVLLLRSTQCLVIVGARCDADLSRSPGPQTIENDGSLASLADPCQGSPLEFTQLCMLI